MKKNSKVVNKADDITLSDVVGELRGKNPRQQFVN